MIKKNLQGGGFMNQKKETRGGRREGAGRPRKENKVQREAHSVRAFKKEWKLIKYNAQNLKKKNIDRFYFNELLSMGNLKFLNEYRYKAENYFKEKCEQNAILNEKEVEKLFPVFIFGEKCLYLKIPGVLLEIYNYTNTKNIEKILAEELNLKKDKDFLVALGRIEKNIYGENIEVMYIYLLNRELDENLKLSDMIHDKLKEKSLNAMILPTHYLLPITIKIEKQDEDGNRYFRILNK